MSITYEDLNDNERLAVQNLTSRDSNPLTLGRAIELVTTRRVEKENAKKIVENIRIEQEEKNKANEAAIKELLIKQRKEAAEKKQEDWKAGEVKKEEVKVEKTVGSKQDPIKPFENRAKPKSKDKKKK